MNIRKANIEDLEKVSILIKAVSDIHYEVRKNIFKLKQLNGIKEYVESAINDEETKVIVAEEDNVVCRGSYL